MKEYHLNIGETVVAKGSATMVCYGLASCIGLFVADRSKKLTGGAHIFFPRRQPTFDTEGMDTETAINSLLVRLQLMGSNLKNLKAWCFGGACMVKGLSASVGTENFESVKQKLVRNKVFIAHTDVGGHKARTVRFFSDNYSYQCRKNDYSAGGKQYPVPSSQAF